MSVTQLDTKGMKCPLPVLKARKVMKSLSSGDVLDVLATDPSAVADFQAFCETTGHALLDWQESDGVYRFTIEKRAGS